MRILVTGGAGFIGSHTCVALLERGYEVIVIDSYINSHEKSLKNVAIIVNIKNQINNICLEIVKADMRDEKKIDELFASSKALKKPIKAVLHFAGLKSVKESVINPIVYWDVNITSSINLLKVMNKYDCRTIVFSSSATIYGLSKNQSVSEESTINPINPYGKTKSTIEILLNDIYNSNPEKWRIVNLRYFNPIGAHNSGLIGEDPMGIPNNIFPLLTQIATGNLKKLNIYGNDWPTRDGTGIRDYIHVMDLAEGHLAALEYLNNNKPQIINLNLGTGKGTTVLELVQMFEEVNKVNIPYTFSKRRSGDVAYLVADNSLAISSLNWIPKRSLREMCADGWKWQSLNPDGYK